MLSIRSNTYYEQKEGEGTFELNPLMELIIIHTSGKEYEWKKNDLLSTNKFEEIRLMVSPSMLSSLIVELQLHQTKLESIQKNATQLTALVKHINENKTQA